MYDINTIQVNVLSNGNIITVTINLDIIYKDVPANLDATLIGGLIKNIL